MAPLVPLLALLAFALFSTAAASPHVARHALDHAHLPRRVHMNPSPPLRRRTLNRRCAPHTNTTSLLPSSTAPLSSQPSPSSSSYLAPSAPPVPSAPSQPSSQTPSPTPTSAAPTTTPPPATTSSPPSPTTTSTTSPPAQTSSSSSNSGGPSYLYGTQNGSGTWFDVGLGACGITNTDSQFIVAVSHAIFDTYPGYDGVDPNSNPVCGKGITVHYGGQSVQVIVTDRCVGCEETDLDMAPSAFGVLASLNIGRISVTWDWS